jgi:hypothetical protein
MSMSVTQRVMRAASKGALERGLQQAGFRRVGNHLYRTAGDVFHCYNFQASQWGWATSGQFTVNLIVTNQLVYERWTGRPLPKNPAAAMFPVRQRIGHLMPAGHDHWWRVDEEADVTQVVAEVSEALLQYGLPFFDAYPDTAAMLDRVRVDATLPGLTTSHAKLVHAILAWSLGSLDEAREVFRAELRKAQGSPFYMTVERLAARLGASVPGELDV